MGKVLAFRYAGWGSIPGISSFFFKKSTYLKNNLTKYSLMSQWHMGIVLALSWTGWGSTLAINLSFSKISTSLNNFMFTKRIYICHSGTWVKCLPLVKQDWVQFQGPTSLFLRLVLNQRMSSSLPKRFTYVPVA